MPKQPKPSAQVVGRTEGHAESKDDEAARKREAKAEKKREAKRLAKERAQAEAPARPLTEAPARPAAAAPEPKVEAEETPSERKREANQKSNSAPPPPEKDKEGLVGGDVVYFEQLRPNVTYLIEKMAKKHLESRAYDVKYHVRWTDAITQDCLDACKALSPNFKWMVSCLIVEKKDRTAVFSESVAYYDPTSDGCAAFEYQGSKCLCVVHVFCAAI